MILNTVIQTYLSDEAFLAHRSDVRQSRERSIPTLRATVEAFVGGTLNIEQFRTQIDRDLRRTDTWGATGTGWMMEINKLPKYYDNQGHTTFRSILNGLNAGNLGERIETFYTFAQQKARASQTNKRESISPGNSAFIVSLFAFWLDPDGRPPIYYVSLRRGLKRLLDAGLLSQSLGLHVGYDSIEVRSAADHTAVLRALDSIRAANPQVASDNFWAEHFLGWVDTNPGALLDDDADDDQPNTAAEVIPHEPLARVPEAQLAARIATLRSRILVSEELVRRIYHALLVGHVILTGPPGTGKTELATLIPELLWQSDEVVGSSSDPYGDPLAQGRTTSTAYTARVVTATDEWSVRTLIGGLAPKSSGRDVFYSVQHGLLTDALLSNWAVSRDNPAGWATAGRVSVRGASALYGGAVREFRGRWLVIDEFNRAPIDLALGEALTALGGSGGLLRVPTDDGTADLPLPQDFRIIGTLNSFDRNYLNQISEALKRRFAFIEVPPPTRTDGEAEQTIALYKALASIAHLSGGAITRATNGDLTWAGVLTIALDATGVRQLSWDAAADVQHAACETAWSVFEVVRVYRQLGTAQAIVLMRQMLVAGLLQGFTTGAQWQHALDLALCDTVADQLQVLLPDELEVLITRCTRDPAAFVAHYNALLGRLGPESRRMQAQLDALSAVIADDGTPLLADADVETLIAQDAPRVTDATLTTIFRLDVPLALPQFARRLRAYRTERGL